MILIIFPYTSPSAPPIPFLHFTVKQELPLLSPFSFLKPNPIWFAELSPTKLFLPVTTMTSALLNAIQVWVYFTFTCPQQLIIYFFDTHCLRLPFRNQDSLFLSKHIGCSFSVIFAYFVSPCRSLNDGRGQIHLLVLFSTHFFGHFTQYWGWFKIPYYCWHLASWCRFPTPLRNLRLVHLTPYSVFSLGRLIDYWNLKCPKSE